MVEVNNKTPKKNNLQNKKNGKSGVRNTLEKQQNRERKQGKGEDQQRYYPIFNKLTTPKIPDVTKKKSPKYKNMKYMNNEQENDNLRRRLQKFIVSSPRITTERHNTSNMAVSFADPVTAAAEHVVDYNATQQIRDKMNCCTGFSATKINDVM